MKLALNKILFSAIILASFAASATTPIPPGCNRGCQADLYVTTPYSKLLTQDPQQPFYLVSEVKQAKILVSGRTSYVELNIFGWKGDEVTYLIQNQNSELRFIPLNDSSGLSPENYGSGFVMYNWQPRDTHLTAGQSSIAQLNIPTFADKDGNPKEGLIQVSVQVSLTTAGDYQYANLQVKRLR